MAVWATKFWELPRREKVLLAEAAVFVAASRMALRCRRRENSWRPLGIPMWTVGGVDAERMAWAVSVTAERRMAMRRASCSTGRNMADSAAGVAAGSLDDSSGRGLLTIPPVSAILEVL